MKDRSNIIKEAIEYRDKLEKKVEELAQAVVRLQISLDFADNTIKKKDRENAELKAYKDVNEDFKTAWEELKAENETLKSQLDFEVQKKEVLEAENDRLKEELATYRAIGVREVCSDKANKLADKYLGCLQEIKEICKETCRKRCTNDCLGTKKHCGYGQILQLITKAESEEE